MKPPWLSCSGNCARHTSAVMSVIRLYPQLETRHALHSLFHCSFLVSLMVFRLVRSLRGIRDDCRALGNPRKMDFSPGPGRAVRRKGCAVAESVAGCCQQPGLGGSIRSWDTAACAPLPAPRCLRPARHRSCPTTLLLPPTTAVCCPRQQLWLHLPTASPVLTLSY